MLTSITTKFKRYELHQKVPFQLLIRFQALRSQKSTKMIGISFGFLPHPLPMFSLCAGLIATCRFANSCLDLCRDVLDDDSRIEVPKNPRAALLAEKFISDRFMRVETKHYVYEGQVDEDGKPHGQVSMLILQ